MYKYDITSQKIAIIQCMTSLGAIAWSNLVEVEFVWK